MRSTGSCQRLSLKHTLRNYNRSRDGSAACRRLCQLALAAFRAPLASRLEMRRRFSFLVVYNAFREMRKKSLHRKRYAQIEVY